MKNGMIIEIKNLGVPVQHPTKDNSAGHVIRWSSDPEVAEDAPAHIVIGSVEFNRFVKLAVPEEFINNAAMTIHPVEVESGQTTMSRHDAVHAGASNESWDNVRTMLVIIGKVRAQPQAFTREWYGSRDDYFAKEHIIAGAEFAKTKGIDQPVIFTDDDISKLLNSATSAQKHLLTMNPALRTTKLMNEVLQRGLAGIDTENIHPDRAMHILAEIKDAANAHQDLTNLHNTTLNLNADTILSAAKFVEPAPAPAPTVDEPAQAEPVSRPYSGPRLH